MLLGLRARLRRWPAGLAVVVVLLGSGVVVATAHPHPPAGHARHGVPSPGDHGACGPADALCAVALMGLVLLSGMPRRTATLTGTAWRRWIAPARARPGVQPPVLLRVGRLQI